ncbi:MAG TPA: hypothetical protein VFI65_24045 [Streptosporangiaceae bacterium]|nr:hypothetical protein [Streptosporangiaceae bacterium]
MSHDENEAVCALAMSVEVSEWLAELRDGQPPVATLVVHALAALMTEGTSLGPPLLVPVAEDPPTMLPSALDWCYQQFLEECAAMRGRAAYDPGLAEASRRLQEQADAFRIRKEVLKASYLTAHLEAAIAAAEVDGGQQDQDAGTVQARLAELTTEIEQELGRHSWPADLMELRPGAPENGAIRILFAFEPAGTALLLAVLEGQETIAEHFGQALGLAADTLCEVRAGQAPEATARTYDDSQSFFAEYDRR